MDEKEEKLNELLKILAVIVNVEYPSGFMPKAFTLDRINSKIVVTPMDGTLVWGVEYREITVELAKEKSLIKVYGLINNDSPAIEFAKKVVRGIKNNRYFDAKYDIKIT